MLLGGRIEEAAVHFGAILDRDPAFVQARFNFGLALLKQGDYDNAIKQFEVVVDSEETNLQAQAAFYQSLALLKKKDLSGAAEQLRVSTTIDPSFAPGHLALGTVLERQGDFEKAGRAYKKALTLEPKSVIATLRFGVSAHRAGFREAAITYLRRVELLAPGSREALEAQKYLMILEK